MGTEARSRMVGIPRSGWKRFSAGLLCGLAAVTALSCGGKVPITRYYILTPAAPAPAQASPSTGRLFVKEVRPARMLRRDSIMYRPGANEVAYYQYHRWASDPAAAVSRHLEDALRARALFGEVLPYDGSLRPGYLLEGELERLEHVTSGGKTMAHATLSAALSDVRTGTVLWRGRGSAEVPVEGPDMPAVVAAMSAAVTQSIDRLLSQLATALHALPPPSQSQ